MLDVGARQPNAMAPKLLRRHPYFSAVNDLEQTKGLVGGMYCEHEMSLTERGRLNAWMNAAPVRGLVYSVMGYGLGSRATPGRTETFYPVMIPLSGGGIVRVGTDEVAVAPGVGVVVSATAPMQAELSSDTTLLIICVGQKELERCAADVLGAPITEPLTFEPRFDLADGRVARWCRQVLLDIDDLDSADSMMLGHSEAARTAEWRLITSLLLVQPNSYSEQLARTESRLGAGRIVRIVDEYIDAYTGEPLRVADLAAQANCSVRALQTAFKAAREQSPMRYLREQRLRLAREKLTVARPGSTTVTAIAASCGLTHHGNFAKAYWNRFGESPSVTLRRG